jgi:hypothetical protein
MFQNDDESTFKYITRYMYLLQATLPSMFAIPFPLSVRTDHITGRAPVRHGIAVHLESTWTSIVTLFRLDFKPRQKKKKKDLIL